MLNNNRKTINLLRPIQFGSRPGVHVQWGGDTLWNGAHSRLFQTRDAFHISHYFFLKSWSMITASVVHRVWFTVF